MKQNIFFCFVLFSFICGSHAIAKDKNKFVEKPLMNCIYEKLSRGDRMLLPALESETTSSLKKIIILLSSINPTDMASVSTIFGEILSDCLFHKLTHKLLELSFGEEIANRAI